MDKKLENAHNLYLRGIRDGEITEVLTQYMGETYTQHSTGVSDGKEGFAQFFTDFFKRNPKRDIQIVRSFSDGNYVFMQVYQTLNDGAAKWVTADIFRADESERIVEHWDVIEAYKDGGKHDQVFGSEDFEDLDKTEENKKRVRLFLVEVLQNHATEKFSEYVADDIISHQHKIADGSSAYQEYLQENNVEYDFIFKVIGHGNYVVAYSQALINSRAYAVFDIFRLQAGKIVERYAVTEPIPAKTELTNSGKF